VTSGHRDKFNVETKHPPRINLESLTAAHAEELFPLLSDPAIYTFIPGQPPASMSALTDRFRRLETCASPDGSERWLNWAIRRLEDRQCVGYVQATVHPPGTADLAFVLGPAFWGRGLAREACTAALNLLRTDFSVPAVFATVDRRNHRSSGLLVRLGFQQVPPAAYPHGPVEASDEVFRLDLGA
jgi:[ribosomal protein S5]-alanine N-acetyltransferase